MPRDLDEYVREKLPKVVTPIYAQRQVRGLDHSKQMVSRTLLVTDFCTSGSVDEHSKQQFENTEKFLGASDIMIQMTKVYLEMKKIDIIFPDSKLTNWLVDSDGIIQIADTKSFLKTQDGQLTNVPHGLLGTKGFLPKEILSWPYDAEKLHASLLGRNIYAYLTGLSPSDEALEPSGRWPSSDSSRDLLDAPIFKTAIGKEYKVLIQSLIKSEPGDRINLTQALAKLQELGVKATKELIKKPEIGPALSSIVSKTVASVLTKPGFSKLLDDIEAISKRCDHLMDRKTREIPSLKSVLYAQKNEIMQTAASLDDLKNKLHEFKTTLMTPKLETLLDQYKQLESKIRECNTGYNESEIDEILNYSAKNIIVGGKINDKCISDMEKVKTGLELNKIEFNKKMKHYEQLKSKIRECNTGYNESEIDKILNDSAKNIIVGGKINDKCISDMEEVKTVLELNKIEFNEKMKHFKLLKHDIEKTKIGDNDSEMADYLSECEKKIIVDGKINDKCISEMEKVKTGLQLSENVWVKQKITDYKNMKWYNLNAGEKARRIEDAMKRIPISDRAEFLASTHKGVMTLLSALAWHRINPFAKPIQNERIVVSSSANTFKSFKTEFDRKIRKELIDENLESTPPLVPPLK